MCPFPIRQAERSDMVYHFAQHLTGVAHTQHAWVQSYGSRCVRPPIIYGDVTRPAPMTVEDYKWAQQLTPKPVKGSYSTVRGAAQSIYSWLHFLLFLW